MIHELKVTLKNVDVPVSRTLQIESDSTFYDLHRVIQATFGWSDSHLHSFFVTRTQGKPVESIEICTEEDEFNNSMLGLNETYDEKKTIVADWFKINKDRIMYTYDFGDNWEHEILFNKKLQHEIDVTYPRCIDAKHLAPPEDSRGEIVMGEVDLELTDTDSLMEEISDNIEYELADMLKKGSKKVVSDYRHDVLLQAKELYKLKPWKTMYDDHIFMVVDPMTKQDLFCSILGHLGEVYGLAVYLGQDGFRTLIDTMDNEKPYFMILQRQRSLLLSFEDRNDLEKEEYDLIKTYDIPFRGRKAWPSFRSMKPGYYPWFINQEEERLMLVALEQMIKVYEEMDNKLEIPDMFTDKKVLAKIPHNINGEIVFENEIVEIEHYLNEEEIKPTTLTISELDLKRIKKFKQQPLLTIEFTMEYIDIPLQNIPNERPVFPLLIIGVDHNEGVIYHQKLVENELDYSILQAEFIEMIQSIEEIPGKILTNKSTKQMLEPLLRELGINVEEREFLPTVQLFMEGLHESLS